MKRSVPLAAALAAAIAACAAGAAHAGWQKTAWGMSLDEVKAAYPGKTDNPRPGVKDAEGECFPGDHVGLKMDYAAAGRQWDATFCFDADGRLDEIGLDPKGEVNSFALENDLYARYGREAVRRSSGMTDVVTWFDGDTEITLLASGKDKATVSYRAKRGGAGSGL
jgi:hypothetical protein